MLVSRGHRRRHARGFTLIELVTTITVMAVFAGLALPSFREFVANQRIRNVSFDLMASLTLARSEAVTRGIPVTLKQSSTSWDQGWKVIATDASNTIIQNQEAYKGLSITDSASLGAVSYGKDGRAVTASTKFTVAPLITMTGVNSRCISIGLSGVPSSSMGACQ
ncbi:type II secretion system protein H [Variovorax sp. SRS16]|uniref:GspH/FimT family pseudopilin n=1 Tax=Variovorax sp. SRS16 TaxID=282217 RepID=UPI00131929B4|nr:GspH/FimT family pseudopilin [Variovorax sp. SRS16]VTU16765.1 type II secretion system protein H [Variovorax sp. SRS16]